MKNQKRGTPPRRRKKAKPRPRVTTLARRPAHAIEMLPQTPLIPSTLTNDPLMPTTFVGTLKLTDVQVASLRRPVEDSEIEWRSTKKDGPDDVPFLSHNGYRDRLDAAFGIGGWGMVPVGMPREMPAASADSNRKAIYVPYALCIEGLPRIFTWGEQEINRMSYGDALEGAKSNAIVRCGKELGIARQLWDRRNVKALQERFDVYGHGRKRTPAAEVNPHADEAITDPQRKRFWAIVKDRGRLNSEVEVWLAAKYQITDTRKMKRGVYDEICNLVGKPGPLEIPEEPAL
jgi:hypothetical protein